AINLLESNGYAYTLSRPSLVALSGQTANFLAGGEVPVPVPQGQGGSVGIEYKEFGVRLTISPTVLSPQQILLRVAPEVSELDFTNAITIQGSIVPALRIRRTDTSISLADGESFIISGLVSRNTMSNVDKMPGLGNIPVLGAFFRSSRFESEDRELLMIVTPRLVRPIAADARLPVMPAEAWRRYSPGAGSLFWQGVTPPYTERPIEAGR
ncbi:MAG: secretin, partial [Acinetobacter sp.]|nr:secretin [Acinetobacter sp.]